MFIRLIEQTINGANKMTTRTRAPKGGITIMGVFYKGGQFLPQYAPNRDDNNNKSNTRSKYIKKNIINQPQTKIKLYKGDKIIEDKNGFKTVRRGLWYRMNIGCS
jgi:hypothetical protein